MAELMAKYDDSVIGEP
jgi:hypothetical protein